MNIKVIKDNLARVFKSTARVNSFTMDHDQYIPTSITLIVNPKLDEKPEEVDPVKDRELIQKFASLLNSSGSGYFVGSSGLENMVYLKKNAEYFKRREYLDINSSKLGSAYMDDLMDRIEPNHLLTELSFDMTHVRFLQDEGIERFASILNYLEKNGRYDIGLHLRQATQDMQSRMHKRGINPHYTVHIER